MKTFDYFFGLLLGERLFLHTDNLSATLQKKKISAVESQRIASQTVETLNRIRSEESFNAFYESVYTKKDKIDEIAEPTLKRKVNAPKRFELGMALGEHPATAKDHYRKLYLEGIDLLVAHIKDRFKQPSFIIYQRLESLLTRALVEEIESLETEIEEIGKINDEVDVNMLPAHLVLFRTMMDNEKLTCFHDILLEVQKLNEHQKMSIRSVVTIVNLLNVNPCSSASAERSFSAARRSKTWLRSTMSQKRFNSVTTLNVHKLRTDKIDIVDVANKFVGNCDNRLKHFGRFTKDDMRK